MTTAAPSRTSYPGIQALRLFAALSVLIYHSLYYFMHLVAVHPSFNPPEDPLVLSRGVTVFFVISGFVMAMTSERARPLPFITHRALRIYGGYFMAILVAVCIKFVVFGSFPTQVIRPKALSLLPLGPREYPLGIEWTLIYEVFFYAVVACLLTIRRERIRRAAVIVWLVAIFVANYAIGPVDRFTALLPMPGQLPLSLFNLGFIAGMICWWIRRHAEGYSFMLIPFGVSLIIATMLSSGWLARELMAVSGASLLVLGMATRDVGGFPGNRNLLVRYGDASYGLYLMHVTLLGAAFAGNALVVGLPGYIVGLSVALGGGIAFGVMEFRVYQALKVWTERAFSHFRLSRATALSQRSL